MKNLRKVLSLILVVAMACSFMVFASAKDYKTFTDADKISEQYLEAVDVVAALGIFSGNDDGSLDPQGYFTRAQAAKIVTYLSIGATAAERLTPSQPFDDVPVTHWASGYIAYAKEAGIISGYGDGNFGPEDAVTGSQFAKMMNTVLGYGKMGEYEGPSWEINAISTGVSRGLITGNADLTAPALREEVIQYVWNTIRPDGGTLVMNGGDNYMVEYSSIINGYTRADGSGGTQGSRNSKTTIGSYIFGLTINRSDDNSGYPVHNWRVGANVVTDLYADKPADFRSTDGTAIYTSVVALATRDLESKYNLVVRDNGAADVYYNGLHILDNVGTKFEALDGFYGVTVAAYNAAVTYRDVTYPAIANPVAADVALYNEALATIALYEQQIMTLTGVGRRGVIVDIYLDFEGYLDRIVIIEKTATMIQSAPVKSSGMITRIGGITEYLSTFYPTRNAVAYAGDVELVQFDQVLFYMDAANVVHIEKFAPVAGQLTRYTTQTGIVAFGGENYTLTGLLSTAAAPAVNVADGGLRAAGNYNQDASVCLDDNGSIVYFNAPAPALAQYMYVLATGHNAFGELGQVRAVLADGTLGTFNATDHVDNYVAAAGADLVMNRVANAASAEWVSYTYNETTGMYTLKTLPQGNVTTSAGAQTLVNLRTAVGGVSPKIQSARTSFIQYAAGGAGVFTNTAEVLGDSSTIVIFYNAATRSVKAYTGINSLPNLDLRTAQDFVTYINVDNDVYADYVFVETNALSYTDIVTVFAMRNQSKATYYGDPNVNAYYDVIINGEVQREPLFDTTNPAMVPEFLLGLYTARTYKDSQGETVYLISGPARVSGGGSYTKLGNLALDIFDAAGNTVNTSPEPFNVQANLPMYLIDTVNRDVAVAFTYDTMHLQVPMSINNVQQYYDIYYTVSETNTNMITSLYFVPTNNTFAAVYTQFGLSSNPVVTEADTTVTLVNTAATAATVATITADAGNATQSDNKDTLGSTAYLAAVKAYTDSLVAGITGVTTSVTYNRPVANYGVADTEVTYTVAVTYGGVTQTFDLVVSGFDFSALI